jgi:ketosteroid isomerase-like protein
MSEDRGIVRAMFRVMNEAAPEHDYMAPFIRAFFHPDVEYREDPSWPGSGTYSGRDAVLERFREYADVMSFSGAEVEDLLDADGVLVAFFDMQGAGTDSGSPFMQPWAWLIAMEDGYVRRLHAFLDRDEALRAAGLDRAVERGGQ